jgi:2-iminobutanoate/2-iminopropanoate deaminase
MDTKIIVDVPNRPNSPLLSPAIRYDNLVFTSGMVGRIPETGQMADGGVQAQARQALENLKTVLEAAGSSLELVLKANCFLANNEDKVDFNEIYTEYFPANPPVRTCTQAGGLSEGVLVEIDLIAGITRD